MRELSQPFDQRGKPLTGEVLEALDLATGGNPALVTFGLEKLWPQPAPSEGDVVQAFASFQQRHREFLRDIRLSFADAELSEAPLRVWEKIQGQPGEVPRADLQEARRGLEGPLQLDFVDVLHLLAASGLIQVEGSLLSDDPIRVRPVASILSLPEASAPAPNLRRRFLQDLEALLGHLHASSADVFRLGPSGEGKQLVPESVFSTYIALGLELLGWQVEREAQHGAGRTDLKLRRSGSEELAVIEVKIWGRTGYREVHQQLLGHWSTGVVVGAVVMLTDWEISDWPATYRRQCLADLELVPVEQRSEDSPIQVRFSYETETRDGMLAPVSHLLLRVPRGG